jgi:hypothetical protein
MNVTEISQGTLMSFRRFDEFFRVVLFSEIAKIHFVSWKLERVQICGIIQSQNMCLTMLSMILLRLTRVGSYI